MSITLIECLGTNTVTDFRIFPITGMAYLIFNHVVYIISVTMTSLNYYLTKLSMVEVFWLYWLAVVSLTELLPTIWQEWLMTNRVIDDRRLPRISPDCLITNLVSDYRTVPISLLDCLIPNRVIDNKSVIILLSCLLTNRAIDVLSMSIILLNCLITKRAGKYVDIIARQ